MSAIKVLHPDIIQKIAAGEVVERPASIVKELVENSIDAGASSISIEIKGGGISYIRVADNGCGMTEEDVPVAFLRHSTSKIAEENDLYDIHTLGFRGEALFSIAAVSQTELESKPKSSPSGFRIVNHGGVIIQQSPFACSDGTSITVKNVFFNIPARLKFLKAPHLEAAAIGDIVTKQLLGNPHISFRFSADGRELYHSPGNGDIQAAIHAVYGADTVRSLIPVEYVREGIRLHGFVGAPHIAQHNRSRQYFYVNGRYVEFSGASFSVQQAFGSRLMVKRYPFFVLYLEVDNSTLDVNVHPQKLNVRFSNEKVIKDLIFDAVSDALQPGPTMEAIIDMDDTVEYSDNGSENMLPWERDNPFTKVEQNISHESHTPVVSTFILPEKGDTADALREILVEGRSRQNTKYVLNETTALGDFESSLVSSAILIKNYDYVVVGQAFDTYLVIQMGDKLLLIDQHAAHERILYERFMHDIAQGNTASQSLLFPYILQLSPSEYGVFEQHIDILRSLGFDLEDFGGYSVRVNAVPHLLGQPQLPAFFGELISNLNEIRHLDSAVIKKDAIIKMACRKAIKAGDKLTDEEIEMIMSQYGDGEKPLTCPHGRPIVLVIEKKALEKGFKRLV